LRWSALFAAAGLLFCLLLVVLLPHSEPEASASPGVGTGPAILIHEANRDHPRGARFARDQHGKAILPSEPASSLASALNLTSDLPFKQRLRLLREYSAPLTPHEQQALLNALQRLSNLSEPPEQQWALANEILNLFKRAGQPEAMLATLHEMVRDPQNPATLRDYLLQHLASTAPAGESHWQTIESGHDDLAATALLHLASRHRRVEDLTAEQLDRLKEAAYQMAADPDQAPANRLSALQVCARLGVARLRPVAMQIARDADQTYPLRISAIAALGDLPPTPDTLVLLEHFAGGREPRLRLPAQSALSRIHHRQDS